MSIFEFVRLGIPCTVQTRNKSRLDNYRLDLRRIALGMWDGNTAPIVFPVRVVISQPILDALNGLVYQDDLQVVRVVSQKMRVLDGALLPVASPVLSAGLRSRDDFLHILVEWE